VWLQPDWSPHVKTSVAGATPIPIQIKLLIGSGLSTLLDWRSVSLKVLVPWFLNRAFP
jgi:hypothetical protein